MPPTIYIKIYERPFLIYNSLHFSSLLRVYHSLSAMKFCFVSVLLFLSLPFSVFGQEEATIGWYENLYALKKQHSVERDLKLGNNKLGDAIKSNNKPDEVRALIELGVLHLARTKDYEKAVDVFIRSLVMEDSLGMNRERVFTYLGMARVFEEVGNYDKSIDFLDQAAKLNEATGDKLILVFILNETGRTNTAYGKIDKAFENFEIALDYAHQLEQPAREADALFYLGQLESKKGKQKEALKKQKESLRLRRSIKDRVKEAASLNEIGELYRQMKDEKRALANHVAALEINQGLKDQSGIAQSYNNIGALYFLQKNFKRAISNLELAVAAGREIQDTQQLYRSYDYLSQCHKELKDYKTALEYKELFAVMQDFIQAEKNERHLLETQNRYWMEKKENEIGQLEAYQLQREKVIEAQDKQRNFLYLLIAFGLIIVMLVLYLYFMKRRANRALQEINVAKDRLFSIIGHDLKGPLNSLTSFSGLLLNHADQLTKDEIKMLSTDLDKSLKNLLALLENLLEWSRSQTGNIDFKREAFDLTAVLNENVELLKGQAQNKKITILPESKTNLMAMAHRNSINTVVRNLLSNAIKFTPESGTIMLTVEVGKQLIVSVNDTGVGMSEATIQKLFKLGTKHSTLGTSKEKGTGLGLILCKDFVEKNGGTIGVESQEGKGSRFYFTVSAQ
jgi:signal transduction histidine kinase